MKLIDKSALVAWAKETYLCENASMIRKVCYKQLLEHLNSLEVKEVELEKEIKEEYLKRRHYAGKVNMLVILNESQFSDIANHFFELGLKVQKGGLV